MTYWQSHNGETDLTIHQGDALTVLRSMPAESVHCCITSPPYWGLRDYGADGQIGLEDTPEAYVARLVEVFREVRRVLREDGTCWLNLGDSYAGSGRGLMGDGTPSDRGNAKQGTNRGTTVGQFGKPDWDNLKPKDLVGIPWLVAFALRADGWWLRSDIIWSKPNPMPESVTDRPTKAHEYLFLLAKSERYYYDADAVREPHQAASVERDKAGWTAAFKGRHTMPGEKRPHSTDHNGFLNPAGRNRRTVWTIATQPYTAAHFAVFPPALVEPCIKAGTSEKGCCPKCGAPWVRVTERVATGWDGSRYGERVVAASGGAKTGGTQRSTLGSNNGKLTGKQATTGWQPTCTCDQPPTPCTVLDPFMGSGTTLLVAQRLGRSGVGIELNAEYCEIAKKRLAEHKQMRLALGVPE